jgi:UDP-N-acetylglucosamine--N-acetylmuramyl-(pentapeptide) pyrophosphoryl-undecaprenol N-acetylglucosamine transferase
VTEIAAVGAAAVFVPFPFAVDDHQTTNARFLVDAGGGWLVQQRDLKPQWLAELIQITPRDELIRRALAARRMRKTTATDDMVKACEELARS